jgi:hypothetical protein
MMLASLVGIDLTLRRMGGVVSRLAMVMVERLVLVVDLGGVSDRVLLEK